ncbi:MAG: hypothetical protein ACK4VP_07960, partial [Nitrospira sp.]
MMNRVLLFVLDGFGIGPLPDAAQYGDANAHTLAALAEAVGGIRLPNLEALGLGWVVSLPGMSATAEPQGCFGRLGFTGQGIDSVVGHWEINGVLCSIPFHCTEGVPWQVTVALEEALGRKVMGQSVSSQSSMLKTLGTDHLASGSLIVWTDGRNTCFVAAHEAVMSHDQLARGCQEAWKKLKQQGMFLRVVAQPLAGEGGALYVQRGRREFVIEPPDLTMLDVLNRSGQIIIGVGKVGDVFSGRGLTRTVPAYAAEEAVEQAIGLLNKLPRGLLYVCVDLPTDDPSRAAAALEACDRALSVLFDQLRVGDVVIITGDHGRDLSRPLQRPTREYVPLFVTGPKVPYGVDL